MAIKDKFRFFALTKTNLGAVYLIVIAIGILLSWWIVVRAETADRVVLLQQARMVARTINAPQIQSVTGTVAGHNISVCQQLRRQLATVRSTSSRFSQVYLLVPAKSSSALQVKPSDNEEFILIDNEQKGYDCRPLTVKIDDKTLSAYRRVFANRIASVEDTVIFRGRTVVSALVPIINPDTGFVCAILSIGINGDIWNWGVATRASLSLCLLWILLAGISAVFTAVRKGNNLPKPLIRRVLPSITVIILLLIAGAVALLWQQHRQQLFKTIDDEMEEVAKDLQSALEQQSAGLNISAQIIAANPGVKKSIIKGDAGSLLAIWQPVLAKMRREGLCTHFYFFDKNRNCILRLHDSDKYGDKSECATIKKVEQTGIGISGMEPGKLGINFRTVHPVLDEGKLAGYVELGGELENVINSLHPRAQSHIAVIINKNKLNRKFWEDGMRLIGRDPGWDRLKNKVISYASQGRLPDVFLPRIESEAGDFIDNEEYITFAGKSWRTGTLPLLDISGNEIGRLLVMIDISEANILLSRLMTIGITGGGVLFVILMTFIYVLLLRTDKSIRAQNKAIAENEARLREIINASPVPMALNDEQLRITFLNPAFIQTFGYTLQDIPTVTQWWPKAYPDSKYRQWVTETWETRIEDAKRTGKPFAPFEVDVKCNDGSNKTVLASVASISGLYDGNQLVVLYDITERKRAEDALLESKQFIEGIMDAITIRVFWKDKNLVFLGCNSMFARDSGFATPGDIIGKDDFQMVWREFAASYRAVDQEVIESGCPKLLIEESRFDADMKPCTFLTSKLPLYNSKGEVNGVIGTYIDITERKLAEEKLQFQYRLQQLLVDISSKYINVPLENVETVIQSSLGELAQFFDVDRVYVFTYDFDRQTCTNTIEWCAAGIEPQIKELQAVPLSIMTDWVAAHRRGQPVTIPDVLSLPPGGLREVLEPQGIKSLITVPILENNDCAGFIGFDSVKRHYSFSDNEQQLLMVFAQILMNLEHRKRDDVLIRSEQENMRAIFSSTPVGMLLMDERTMILNANAEATRIFSREHDQIVQYCCGCGLGCINSIMDKNECGLSSACADCKLRKGIIQVFESGISIHGVEIQYTVLLAGSEHRFWLNVNIEPVSINNSKHAVVTVEDISSFKNAEIELVCAKEKAEESDRLKSAFLANMSHEIRTPMNGILGFAALLKEPKLSGEQQQEYISIIEKSGDRMLNTINDIINISKVESGQMDLSLDKTNVNEQLEYIHAFFKMEAEEKGLQISFKTGLPKKTAVIITDREKIYGILTNLVKNAIKFTHSGSIHFGYVKKDQYLEFYVKDTGIGIPADRQEAVFDRFVQADIGDTRVFEGSGLGLSISKAFVEMLGGRIWLESEEGKGTTFYFTIPYSVEKEDNNGCDEAVTANVMRSGDKKLKILIADDDETSRMLVSIATEDYCREMLQTVNGVDAVELCRNHSDINLIFMDIKMPGMNGYDAVREIREFNNKVIIIAQTAYALAGERDAAITAGCNDYIAKPFNRVALAEVVNKYF